MPALIKTSFNSGVISPRLGGRIDLAKYESALGICENALPQPWGGVTRRMGTEFINEIEDSTKRARLIPFRYSTEQAYIIETGEEYMRFYMDGGLIQSNDASTVALLHCNGKDASTVFPDSSMYDKTVTASGNAKVDASDGVFSQCVIFSGANDLLSMADSAHWNMATIGFTIDTRIKFSSLPNDTEAMVLFNQQADVDNLVLFSLRNSAGVYSLFLELRGSASSAYPINTVAWTPVVGTWYHLALIRGWNGNANDWTVTVDGVSLGTTTLSTTYPDIAASFNIASGGTGLYYPSNYDANHVKATSNTAVNYLPYLTANPSLSLIGTYQDTQWLSANPGTTNQRWHIDLESAVIVSVIYYENSHAGGAETDTGVNHFTLQGSNDAADFAALNYASTGNWITLNTSTNQFAIHTPADTADPKYFTVSNTVPYRYYALKCADNWGDATVMGLRRLGFRPHTTVPFIGKMDEIRISRATRWTSDFTVPVTPYPLGTSGGSSDYSLTTPPYIETDLRDIYYSQSADTLYLTHPDYPPAILVREAHDDWTFMDITFDWPPFLSQNTTSITLDATASNVGAVSVTASAALFDTTYVGSYFKLSDGYLNVTSVQSSTACSGLNISTLTSHAATTAWSKSAWDEVSGYPSCVTFFEQRLCFGATDEEEQTIWMSVSGDFYNFIPKVAATLADTDSCMYTIDADEVNRIHFLVPSKKLVAGTEGGIYQISGNQDDGVTPSNIKIRVEAAEQAQDEIMPVRFGNSVLFSERGGKIIREFAYNFQTDAYEAKDLIILAEHLTRNNKILEVALQRIPFKVLWCVLDNGKVISLTYLKEHEVVGWTLHDFGGDVESVAIIPGTTDDEVWFIIKRTVNSAVVRYIERLKPNFTGESEEDAFYVDSGLTYDGTPTTIISGLSHLIGESVMCFADGNLNITTTVTSAGQVALSNATSVCHIGKGIETELETLRVSQAQFQGKDKRISYVTIRFFETAGEVKLGVSGKMDTINLGTPLRTFDHKFTFPSGYDEDGKILIQKTDSFPMTILAIVPDIEMYKG